VMPRRSSDKPFSFSTIQPSANEPAFLRCSNAEPPEAAESSARSALSSGLGHRLRLKCGVWRESSRQQPGLEDSNPALDRVLTPERQSSPKLSPLELSRGRALLWKKMPLPGCPRRFKDTQCDPAPPVRAPHKRPQFRLPVNGCLTNPG
jgi:hypothetical protein